MSTAIILASSVRRIVPVEMYRVTENGIAITGNVRNFDAACAYMRGLVNMGRKGIAVDSFRTLSFE